MKEDIVKELVKVNGDLIIPGFLVKNIAKLNLEIYELILLLYFINQKNNITFDVNKISLDLNIESSKVLELINSLNEKNYISIEMKKNNGVIEEYISTELFYNKIESMLLDNSKKEKDSDIYSLFEKEFGRTLSPTEYDSINNWIENGISEELIKEALKEATSNNVSSIRYMDKILYEWGKKGIKNREDVLKMKNKREEKVNKEEKEIEIDTEIFDWDWLNEEE